jgi:transposase
MVRDVEVLCPCRHGSISSSMEKLDVWLQDARLSGVYGIQRFARAAGQDFDAVRNAILEPWSSGQTEGQINRLEILKGLCMAAPASNCFARG